MAETRFCAYCAAPMGAEEQTCPSCGRPRLGAPAPHTTMDTERQNRLLWVALGGAGLLLVILLVMLAKGRGPGVTQAPTEPKGPPVALAPPANPGPPVALAPRGAQPTPPKPDPMRQAVEAYLLQVEQVEAQRKAVVNNLVPALAAAALARQMGGLEGLFDQLDPDYEAGVSQAPANPAAAQARATIDGYITDLQNQASRLSQIRPPTPANALQSAYFRAFSTYIQVLLRIRGALDAPPGQEQAVAAALQRESPGLEAAKTQSLAAADAELARLTQRYGLQRRFSISDQPESGILR